MRDWLMSDWLRLGREWPHTLGKKIKTILYAWNPLKSFEKTNKIKGDLRITSHSKVGGDFYT